MSKSRDAIEAQRTALSAVSIGTSVQAYDADTAKLDVEQTYTAAQTFGTVAVTGNVDGRDVSVDGAKLDGVEANATTDQTGAQIKTAYQAETNAFTDAQFTKLAGVAASANNYSHPSNHAISVVTGLQSALDGKTTESYVNTAVSNLVDSSPAALNTLNELAAALGDDANFSTTTATALGLRVAKDSATGAASMPTGTTAQRPTGALGMFRHNTTLNQFEGYNDGAWGALAGGDEVSFVTYEYIATAGQTTFSGADSNSLTLAYTPANIIVSYGGQDLPHSDYTATNGTSVVLDDGAVVGEIVRIVAFTAFTVADTYTQAQIDSKDATKLPLAGGTMTGDVTFADNIYAKFGTGNDLRIRHDGSNSYIAEMGTGNLIVQTNGADFLVENTDGDNMINAISDGAVELSHNNAVKLATTATGIGVTGSSSTFDSVSGDLILYLTTGAVSDKNQIIFGDGGTSLARIGVGGTAGDIIADSQGQDFNIRTAAGGRAINFSTDNGASTAMKIDNGYVHIGKEPAAGGKGLSIYPVGSSTNIYCAFNKDSSALTPCLSFQYNGSQTGAISYSSSATSFITSSDYRLKENVTPMSGATARVKLLKPCNFDWISTGENVDGFLAHEAQEVVPEAVTGTKDAMMDEEYEVTPAVVDDEGNETTAAVMGTRSVPDMQGIDQSKLVPLLTATIQELIARIEALEGAAP